MVNALILMNVQRDRINEVAESLAGIDGISEVYSVAGRYDLIAVIRVRTNEELAELVTDTIRSFESITHTETLIAFRTYSRHDLEQMFSIGL
jgi:DNA-binding Lrp family transcriptional regulator